MHTTEAAQRGTKRSRTAKAAVAAITGLVVLGAGIATVADDGPIDVAGAEPVSAEVTNVAPLATPVESPAAPLPTVTRPVVVLYGDSLAWESKEQFVSAFASLPDVRVETRTFGGTATCDWFEDMRADAASLRPGAVVVEFSGNAFTACMRDQEGQPLTGLTYLSRYRDNAKAVLDIFEPAGTRVYFAGSPIADPAKVAGSKSVILNGMYEVMAAGHPASAEYVDAGAAVLDEGRWTNTLPCVPGEPCEGGTDGAGRPVNVVRAPDTAHFCPVNGAARAGVTDSCPVWSSGAMRFGSAMAAPVVAAIERGRS
jgi:hypothetical protein